MAQVMKTDVWETRPCKQFFELVKHISCWIEMSSNLGTKNIIVFLPSCTCFAFDLQLLGIVLFESLDDKWWKSNTTTSLLCLWFCFNEPLPWQFTRNASKNSTHLQLSSLQ